MYLFSLVFMSLKTYAYEEVSLRSLFACSVPRSVIRSVRQGSAETREDTPDILSCDEARWFWISWAAGFIEVGYGHLVGAMPFMGWLDSDPRAIHALTVTTGFGAEGQWVFNSHEGE